jgi:hypothetical protein
MSFLYLHFIYYCSTLASLTLIILFVNFFINSNFTFLKEKKIVKENLCGLLEYSRTFYS